MQIAASFKNPEGRIYFGREKLVGDAEFIDVKLEGLATSATYTYLVEVGKMFVNVLYHFFRWKGIIYSFLEFRLVASVKKQYSIGFLPISSGTSSLLEVSLK